MSKLKSVMIKRETSTAVEELHSVSERIKRLAISIDGRPVISNPNSTTLEHNPPIFNNSAVPNSINMATFNTQTNGQAHVAPSGFQLTMPGKEMVSVLSTSSDNFDERYEMLNEVGRGGFSIVYRCRDKLTNEICAVKVTLIRCCCRSIIFTLLCRLWIFDLSDCESALILQEFVVK